MPRKDGTTLRKHVAVLARQGIDVSEYIVPPLPPPMLQIWRWFMELGQGRSSNGMGPNALSFMEINAWLQLRRIRIGQYELACLRDLDMIFLVRSSDRG
jgi:hypothetical protein